MNNPDRTARAIAMAAAIVAAIPASAAGIGEGDPLYRTRHVEAAAEGIVWGQRGNDPRGARGHPDRSADERSRPQRRQDHGV